MAESNPHETSDDDYQKQKQLDLKTINDLKLSLRSKVESLIKELDIFHPAIHQVYKTCISQKCQPLYQSFQGDSFKVKDNKDSTAYFLPMDKEQEVA